MAGSRELATATQSGVWGHASRVASAMPRVEGLLHAVKIVEDLKQAVI